MSFFAHISATPRPSVLLRHSPYVSPQVKKNPYLGDEMEWEITLLDRLACAQQVQVLVRQGEELIAQQLALIGWGGYCDDRSQECLGLVLCIEGQLVSLGGLVASLDDLVGY